MIAWTRPSRIGHLAFVNDIDKLPLPVKSAPGFLVNRALTPYLMEAFICASRRA